jgi:hypothetical protein
MSEPLAATAAPPVWMPPGHFYSPIPGAADTARALDWRAKAAPLDDLPGIDMRADAQRSLLHQVADCFRDVPTGSTPGWRYTPDNPMFGLADAAVYHAVLRHLRPRRVLEFGSGYTSALALDTAERFLDDSVDFTFVDPDLSRLRDLVKRGDLTRHTVLRRPAQDTDPALFARLEAGDVLFVDSTHVAKAGSDVVWLLGEVLPRLKPGVWVHFHDVFWPFDYPEAWLRQNCAWNELYALRAFLTFNQVFAIELFASWLWPREAPVVRAHCPQAADLAPGSLWLRRRGPDAVGAAAGAQ